MRDHAPPKEQKPHKNFSNLRRNMTKEERHLWYDFLKTYPVQFNRQKVIGSYIVDFYCHTAKLVVELDGSQHFDDTNSLHDAFRTEYLNNLGLDVMRIPNNEIWTNFPGVCEAIDQIVQERIDPHQSADG
jgi:very-short-patch-repair endonuclease